MYTNGLVTKKNESYSKMNIDFIGIINVDDKEFNDTMIPLGVEVKNKIN